MVLKSFSSLLAVALIGTTIFILIAAALPNHALHCSKTFAVGLWLAIICSYVTTAPTELLLGPRHGLRRLTDKPWSIRRLYGAVYLSLFGALIGMAGLAHRTGKSRVFLLAAIILIVYHFWVRHWTTEDKGTPHLGQRGTHEEQLVEVLLGQLGDLCLVVLLVIAWIYTEEPIWLLGTSILLAGYMLSVWIHRWFDREPRTISTYLGPLVCVVAMSGTVLLLGLDPEIHNILREPTWALGIIAAVVVLDRKPYGVAMVAVPGVVIAAGYGYMVGQDKVLTGFDEMLFNPNVAWRSVRDYWVVLAVFSFLANIALSRILELLLEEKNST